MKNPADCAGYKLVYIKAPRGATHVYKKYTIEPRYAIAINI